MEFPTNIFKNIDVNSSPKEENDPNLSSLKTMEHRNNSGSPPRLYLLYGIIVLQSFIFVAEVVIDQMLHSVLILADAYHHLFNSFNAILLVVCYKISNQNTVKNTFGWVRAELIGMLTTITFIVAMIFSLLIEGALQLFHLHEIASPTNPRVLIVFGIWSLIVNILYVLAINGVMTDKKYKQTTCKERSFSTAKCQKTQDIALKIGNFPRNSIHPNVELEKSPIPSNEPLSNFCLSLIQGILSPCFVMFCALFITIFQRSKFVEMIDPLIGITTAISLCITFYPQLKNTFLILMQTVPENVNIDELKNEILQRFNVIQNIHEFHIWRLTSSNIVATFHIILPSKNTSEYCSLFEEIKQFLRSKYGIHYITIQPEFNHQQSNDKSPSHHNIQRYINCHNQCLVKCPCDINGTCESKSCCFADNDSNSHKDDNVNDKIIDPSNDGILIGENV